MDKGDEKCLRGGPVAAGRVEFDGVVTCVVDGDPDPVMHTVGPWTFELGPVGISAGVVKGALEREFAMAPDELSTVASWAETRGLERVAVFVFAGSDGSVTTVILRGAEVGP
jgi:hypothetical protein